MNHSEIYRRAALGMHIALMAAVLLDSPLRLGVLLVLPLLIALPGLWRGKAYTHAWASMLLSFYSGAYLSAAYAHPDHKWISIGIATLAAAEFVSLVLYVRLRSRAASPAQTAASGAAVP